jgi:hypothetical protein
VTFGQTRQPFEDSTRSNPRIQKTGKNQRRRCIHEAPERTNHIHIHDRLVPPGGGGTRVEGRMDEVDLGQVTWPKENVTGELSNVSVQRLNSQDYEEKGIRQIRPNKAFWIEEGGSRRRRISPNKPWVISSTPVKSYQQPTSMVTTNVGDWFMEN